ncbi:hypothetical protein R1flu_010778 [Riccia fluitans]|uniref:Ubiquitin-like protease family profile domain-containing protein n=1 Tax=Riccia fluitans TaxID=41844 RepID=A0ABD1Z5Y0_9MARC
MGMTANRLEMDPSLSTTGQTSGRGSNHILGEHHGRKNQRLASLEEDLAHAKLEEEKLKATIEALEKEKSEMNARVALMERKNLYDLLEAKMEGFQIANHPGMIGGFENLNLTIKKKWVEIPTLNLEEFEKCLVNFPDFVRGHRTLQDEPLVKGLDADDFFVDKFFGLQDPTSSDDVQASPDFEEDLRTNECLRLQTESSMTRICKGTFSVDLCAYSCKNHWSLAIIRLHNDDAWLAHLDSSLGTHDPEAIFHVLKQVLCLIVPIDPALVMTGIMNVEQQQDGYSCGKHVLQMLVGAAMESDGLDRCFREEGLRYIATLD